MMSSSFLNSPKYILVGKMLRVMNDDNKSRGSYLTAQRFFSFSFYFTLINPHSHKKTILIFHHDSNKSEIPLKVVTKKHIEERKMCACEH